MKTSLAGILVPGILAVVGIGLLAWWAGADLAVPLEERVPGLDGVRSSGPAEDQEPPVPGEPIRSDGKPSALAGAWPWFRGPNRDAISQGGVPLARSWPKDGPKELWRVAMGQGYAGPAVRDGCVYVLDYDEEALADTMRCLSLDDGKEIWRNSYPVELAWNHGMSRTVPAVVGKYVISLGPKCHVACWDAETGKCLWLIDLVFQHGAKVPQWYAGQCPLIDGDRLILAPGGKHLLIAVDYKTGEVIWEGESPDPKKWAMTHSSIVPMEFAGKRMYVYCASGGVAGVSADDGALLWHSTRWRNSYAMSPSPVTLDDGRIFLCSGYDVGKGIGSMMLQLEAKGDGFVAKTLFELPPKQFGSENHTPVLLDDHLYGVRKKDGKLVCLDLNGNEVWNSGTDKFGSGPYMIADGLIYVLGEDGLLTMAEATPSQYRPLGHAQVIEDGVEAWGPMALVAGRLIVRDLTRMVCLDVAE